MWHLSGATNAETKVWFKAIACARMACGVSDIKIAEWLFNTDFSVSSDPNAEYARFRLLL